MFARETLSYEPKPLSDRMQLCDTKMIAAASAHLAIMRKRHSVRVFDSRPVPRSIIEDCIRTASLAPSGANHQPWHFVMIGNLQIKTDIRKAAEVEERKFYSRDNANEWIRALEPIGTGSDKPHLVDAP